MNKICKFLSPFWWLIFTDFWEGVEYYFVDFFTQRRGAQIRNLFFGKVNFRKEGEEYPQILGGEIRQITGIFGTKKLFLTLLDLSLDWIFRSVRGRGAVFTEDPSAPSAPFRDC